MDWDNLRYFLELARTGTLAAAARRTGVEHTTVARRIQALEKQMGAPLFAREAAGHRLTEAGRHLLPAVEAMEAAVLGVPSEKWGEEVVAVVVIEADADVDEAGLIAFCRERLADYKCPKRVVLSHEGLTRTASGKIIKREAAKRLAPVA